MLAKPIVRTVRFIVNDRVLRSKIDALVKIDPTPETFKFGYVGPSHCSVVCVSPLPNDPWIRELAGEQQRQVPCGVVMYTEDRKAWADLATVHRCVPLTFIVATGGPRERFASMFPNLAVQRFSDLVDPYDTLIAQYISLKFAQCFAYKLL